MATDGGMSRRSLQQRELPPAWLRRQAHGVALVLLLAAACCAAPARAMCSSPQAPSHAGGGSAKQGTLPGTGQLLREGIVSPVAAHADVDEEAIAQAAQELRIPPLQPAICKVPTEDMPPLADDMADSLQTSASHQARAIHSSRHPSAQHMRLAHTLPKPNRTRGLAGARRCGQH